MTIKKEKQQNRQITTKFRKGIDLRLDSREDSGDQNFLDESNDQKNNTIFTEDTNNYILNKDLKPYLENENKKFM